MTQAYSDPRRASDPYALPDVEVFYVSKSEARHNRTHDFDDGAIINAGWYYWHCFPGCSPDGDAIGPFATETEALADAQEGYDD